MMPALPHSASSTGFAAFLNQAGQAPGAPGEDGGFGHLLAAIPTQAAGVGKASGDASAAGPPVGEPAADDATPGQPSLPGGADALAVAGRLLRDAISTDPNAPALPDMIQTGDAAPADGAVPGKPTAPIATVKIMTDGGEATEVVDAAQLLAALTGKMSQPAKATPASPANKDSGLVGGDVSEGADKAASAASDLSVDAPLPLPTETLPAGSAPPAQPAAPVAARPARPARAGEPASREGAPDAAPAATTASRPPAPSFPGVFRAGGDLLPVKAAAPDAGASMTVLLNAPAAQVPATIGGATPAVPVAARVLDMTSDDQWIAQLASDIAATKSDKGDLSFRLMPRHLGRLDVAMKMEGDGVSLKLDTQHEATATIVAAAQPRLVEDLRQQGVRVAAAEVSCTPEQAGRQPQSQGQNQGRGSAPNTTHLIETANERAEPRNEVRTTDRRGRFA